MYDPGRARYGSRCPAGTCSATQCSLQESWALEASERIAAYERNEIEAEDFDSVMERLRGEFLNK